MHVCVSTKYVCEYKLQNSHANHSHQVYINIAPLLACTPMQPSLSPVLCRLPAALTHRKSL